MNLFLLAWNISENQISRSMTELEKMSRIYTHLDISTIWSEGSGSPVFAASLQSSKEVSLPRKYIFKSGNNITFFDGCLIDVKDKFVANDATQIADNWESVTSSVEGQFVLANICTSPPRIELINDFLGVYQVFYTQIDNTWLISNSVQLISNINNAHALDPSGVTHFLGFGWAGMNRTLRENVYVIPGGQHWIWNQENNSPEKITYFKRSTLAELQKESPKVISKSLVSKLSKMVNNISKNYKFIEAPITAGRDSRVLASLLIKNNINAKYFTSGSSQTTDVRIASMIANKFNLEHRVDGDIITDDLVLDNWDEACQRVINLNDGMVSLAHVKNAAVPDPKTNELYVHFYGQGGEIGRGIYEQESYYLHRHSSNFVHDYLSMRLIRKNNLLLKDVSKQCENYLSCFIDDALADGFAPVDLPPVFYAYERVRRWAGANYRQVTSYKDVFSPFCTRPYVQAAFSISSLHRFSHGLHYNLLKDLVPEMLTIRFDMPFRSQLPILNMAKFISRAILRKGRPVFSFPRKTRKNPVLEKSTLIRQDNSIWFEAKLNNIRQTCLDKSSSMLWDCINKPEFERLTSNNTSAFERKKNIKILYDIYTLFYYV